MYKILSRDSKIINKLKNLNIYNIDNYFLRSLNMSFLSYVSLALQIYAALQGVNLGVPGNLPPFFVTINGKKIQFGPCPISPAP